LTPPVFVVASQKVSRDYFGLHIHRALNDNVWPSVPFAFWRWWDCGIGWLALEPEKGQWDFSVADAMLSLAESRGVKVIFTLGGQTPKWASARPNEQCHYGRGEGCAAEPNHLSDWAEYVRQVATRYKGRIRHYEIWNEPDAEGTPRFFTGTTEKLVELTRTARAVIKSIDQDARILSPGFSYPNTRKIESFLGAGGAGLIDVLSVHFYVYPPETALAPLASVQSMLNRLGLGQIEIWNTEAGYFLGGAAGAVAPLATGWSSKHRFSEKTGAAMLSRMLVLLASRGVRLSSWYSWDHDDMGLASARGARVNPVGKAYEVTRNWLGGSQIHGCIETGERVWVCELGRDGNRRSYMLWQTRPNDVSVKLPPAWSAVKIERLDGTSSLPPGDWVLKVTESPVLLRTDSGDWSATP